jgi:hypothetical protein
VLYVVLTVMSLLGLYLSVARESIVTTLSSQASGCVLIRMMFERKFAGNSQTGYHGSRRWDVCGKGNGTRKRMLSCIALLIWLSVSGCASPQAEPARRVPPIDGAREHLLRAQKLLVWYYYEGALRECQSALAMSGDKYPGDEALLCIGQIYSDPQNQEKDFSKSIVSFQRLTKEYPQSTWADAARVWMENLREQERLKRVMAEYLQDNERLERLWNDVLKENERLRRLSNESAQENLKLKKIVAENSQEKLRLKKIAEENSQENVKLKTIVEKSKEVDLEVDEKKREQTK